MNQSATFILAVTVILNTAASASNSKTIDTDRDGVPDKHDKCPDVAMGVTVDAEGCYSGGSTSGDSTPTININFKSGSSVVERDFFLLLEPIAKEISYGVDSQVTIEGHTDSTGNENLNHALSIARAKEVTRILLEKYNIDADRLITRGFGEQNPIASNATRQGRHSNRRVEIRIR